MLEPLPRSTQIEQIGNDRWRLELVFRASGRVSRGKIEVELDDSMIPVPGDQQKEESVSVGWGPFSLGLPRRVYWADPEQRKVRFLYSWIDLSLGKPLSDQVRREIEFRWVRPNHLPRRVTILVRITGTWGTTIAARAIHGFNVSTGQLLTVVAFSPPADSFYFSSDGLVSAIDYRTVCAIGAELQSQLDSQSWAFTGPHDTALWESSAGIELLAHQMLRIAEDGARSASTRLALCPYALGVEEPTRTRFIESLWVQHLCGVQVRVVSPTNVEDTFGDECRVGGGFGKGFAAEWDFQGDSVSEPNTAELYVEQDRIDYLWRQYQDLARRSMTWREYNLSTRITLSNDQKARIRKRVITVRKRARQLLQAKRLDAKPNTQHTGE